ncbi:hypothetical protein C8F01DRAFT_5166 [Mycena amicta]|nr:hypothetical protein C8F01DRAFT_5166 [Mycena amicta]
MDSRSDATARAADRARLSDVEEEIQRFETPPAALRAQQEQIRGRLAEYKYPILTLPNEIITEIFVHYLPPYPDHPPLVGLGSPTYLLGICRLWRSIALHSPTLWRAIGLSGDDSEISDPQVEMVQTWLLRSGSSPLSLRLEVSYSWVSKTDALLQTVVAHRSRWEYLHLLAPPAQVSLISGPCPRLVKLTLLTTLDPDVNIISLQNAHLLRSVFLWNVDYDLGSLPWDQLTSLSLQNTASSLADSAPILQAATNLLSCQLFLRGTVEGLHIMLARVESLSFNTLVANGLEETGLATFTLPSLRKLEIGEGLLGVHAAERLKALISRSECRLERLRIVPRPGRISEVVEACRIALPLVDVDASNSWRFSDYCQWQIEKEEYWDHITDSGQNSEAE